MLARLIVMKLPMRPFVRFALLAFLVAGGSCCFAAEWVEIDTALAKEFKDKAWRLKTAKRYDSAIVLYQKASRIYERAAEWEQYTKCLNNISDCYSSSYKPQMGMIFGIKALEICRSRLGIEHPQTALAYDKIAMAYRYDQQFDTSIFVSNKALALKTKLFGEQDVRVAYTHHTMGISFMHLEAIDSALKHYHKGVLLHIAAGGSLLDESKFYENINQAYQELGRLDLALIYLSKAARILELSEEPSSTRRAYSYWQMGNIYKKKGAYDLAMEYHERALKMRLNTFGESHPSVAWSYNSVGNVHRRKSNFVEAIKCFQKSLDIRIRVHGLGSPELAIPYNNLGTAYEDLGNYQRAKQCYETALKLVENSVSSTSRERRIALYTSNIGGIHKYEGSLDLALDYFKKALKIRLNLYGKKHPVVAQSFWEIGQILHLKGDWNGALFNFQNGLIAADLEFENRSFLHNPKGSSSLDQSTMIDILTAKSIALEEIFSKRKKIEYLESAYETLLIAETTSSQIRSDFIDFEDRVSVGKKAHQIYEGLIRLCLRLHEETQDVRHMWKAFHFSEKSKSVVLTETLATHTVNNTYFATDSLRLRRSEIQSRKSRVRSEILKYKLPRNKLDSLKLGRLQNELFELSRSEDSLISDARKIQKQDDSDGVLKEPMEIEEIQLALDLNSVLVEYFVGDSATYVFGLSKERYVNLTIANEDCPAKLKKFSRILQESVSEDVIDAGAVNEYSYQLYKVYLKAVLDSLIVRSCKLIIIPDRELAYLPFEVLNTEVPDYSSEKLGNWPYLIKEYKIQYAHSASILFRHRAQRNSTAPNGVLALAPIYETNIVDSVRTATLGATRAKLSVLKWNATEVDQVTEYVSGRKVKGAEALERSFKENASSYNVLHLAMHALVDEKDPMNSKFIFTQATDSVEDNYLHAFELYNMELPAEMVVLSACETGYGKIAEGEGVMSLGRAFSYAGCPSVVTSHWPVNDAATAKLMGLFYKYLAKGQEKDEALRNAKLEYLENADPAQAHPFYWGSFVVVGDVSPLSFVQPYRKWWYLGGGVVFLIIVVFLMQRKKKRSNFPL